MKRTIMVTIRTKDSSGKQVTSRRDSSAGKALASALYDHTGLEQTSLTCLAEAITCLDQWASDDGYEKQEEKEFVASAALYLKRLNNRQADLVREALGPISKSQ